jgi:hypothetical protein
MERAQAELENTRYMQESGFEEAQRAREAAEQQAQAGRQFGEQAGIRAEERGLQRDIVKSAAEPFVSAGFPGRAAEIQAKGLQFPGPPIQQRKVGAAPGVGPTIPGMPEKQPTPAEKVIQPTSGTPEEFGERVRSEWRTISPELRSRVGQHLPKTFSEEVALQQLRGGQKYGLETHKGKIKGALETQRGKTRVEQKAAEQTERRPYLRGMPGQRHKAKIPSYSGPGTRRIAQPPGLGVPPDEWDEAVRAAPPSWSDQQVIRHLRKVIQGQ